MTLRLPICSVLTSLVLSLPAQTTCQAGKHSSTQGQAKGGPQDQRSDSVDLLVTRVHLNLLDAPNDLIHAMCVLRLVPKVSGVTQLRFDLIDLTVGSVLDENNQPLGFNHVNGVLQVDLAQPAGPADTMDITVFYDGEPAVDPSNFGGFYLENNYIYNLGVAFDAQPHSYGRAWFPCFDNFVERCAFSFHVTTRGGRKVWCNGAQLGVVPLGGDTTLTHWSIDEPIPSYLASVAAANYAVVHQEFPSIGGTNIPVDLVALPGDTTAMKNSFIHLQDAFNRFETCFGAYSWNRIGYCLASRGAMEHPTNITYPDFIADGSLQYEATMAHELAHQWFGDLVTCDRAEEMYLNEGFAEYLSYLFLEAVYGPDRYRSTVRANHYDMLRRCHWEDGGQYFALSDVPQEWTYGQHSYNKGADVLHSLRGYLGEALFCQGLTSFLDAHPFRSVSSEQLRDHLSTATGTDLTDFFDAWIFQPGWSAFEVDSFDVGPSDVTVFAEQKLRGAVDLYHNVPLTLSCRGPQGDLWTTPSSFLFGGTQTVVTIDPPFDPVDVWLNDDGRISLATTAVWDTLTSIGTKTLQQANITLFVDALPSELPIRVEQFWVAADPIAEPAFAYVLSPDRWWRIQGDFSSGPAITGRFAYDGRAQAAGGLDVDLMQDVGGLAFTEDSLVLLYRPNAHMPWSLVPQQTLNVVNNATDRTGRIDVDDLAAGDYTLAWKTSAVGMFPRSAPGACTLWPDPAQDHVMVSCPEDLKDALTIRVRDRMGRLLKEVRYTAPLTRIDVSDIAPQVVVINAATRDGKERGIGTCAVIP
ncbi:MAG: M1 family metallopeptidase [Flavobacteriales bacterium]|nr:M1 family metallopeptidase [Flavobacteriales bacterium]MBP6696652.1 M1 family metallopeptidase [Flavobacteriales bacterium]